MVTSAFAAESVAVRLALDPTVTLPKPRLGVTPSCAGGAVGAKPVPATDM